MSIRTKLRVGYALLGLLFLGLAGYVYVYLDTSTNQSKIANESANDLVEHTLPALDSILRLFLRHSAR